MSENKIRVGDKVESRAYGVGQPPVRGQVVQINDDVALVHFPHSGAERWRSIRNLRKVERAVR